MTVSVNGSITFYQKNTTIKGENMILNTFNVQRFIETNIGGFDDSVYIVDYNTNQIIVSIDSMFNWEELANDIETAFPQTDFKFIVIGLDLIITWI